MANDQHDEAEIEARKTAAMKFGFVLGCIAAVIALAIQLFRVRHSLTPRTEITAVVMAVLNVPVGVLLGLIGERATRSRPGEDDQ